MIGEAGNGAEALQLLENGLQPDVVLTDYNMPRMNGLQLVQRINDMDKQLRSIILTMHANKAFLEKALAAGAGGYLLKNGDMTGLVACIRDVYHGRQVIGKEFE